MATKLNGLLVGGALLGLVSGIAPALAQQNAAQPSTPSPAPAASMQGGNDSASQATSGSSTSQSHRHHGAMMRHASRSSMHRSSGSSDNQVSMQLNRNELQRLQQSQ